MNDANLTLIGNVANEPKQRHTKYGTEMTSFRVASTPRRFDKETGRWVDGTTIFMNVACYGALAANTGRSLRKGDAVIVSGKFQVRNWVREEAVQTTYEIVAETVGHDLCRGYELTRVNRASVAVVSVDEDGLPADPTDFREDLLPEDRDRADLEDFEDSDEVDSPVFARAS